MSELEKPDVENHKSDRANLSGTNTGDQPAESPEESAAKVIEEARQKRIKRCGLLLKQALDQTDCGLETIIITASGSILRAEDIAKFVGKAQTNIVANQGAAK